MLTPLIGSKNIVLTYLRRIMGFVCPAAAHHNNVAGWRVLPWLDASFSRLTCTCWLKGPSCSIMFRHVPSYSFMFRNVSGTIMFHHVSGPSCSIVFHHVPSRSIMFCRVSGTIMFHHLSGPSRSIVFYHVPSRSIMFRRVSGTIMFQLRRCTADMPRRKKKRSASATRAPPDRTPEPSSPYEQRPLPFLVEMYPGAIGVLL